MAKANQKARRGGNLSIQQMKVRNRKVRRNERRNSTQT